MDDVIDLTQFHGTSYFECYWMIRNSLQWRHNGRDGVSNYQPRGCLFNRLSRHRSKKTPKLRVTGEFPAQRASNVENISFEDVIIFVPQIGQSLMIVAYSVQVYAPIDSSIPKQTVKQAAGEIFK